MQHVNIIGGGLSGCEAAWQLANRGIKVNLYEMRKANIKTFAHKTNTLCELVCSNSLRSDDKETAIGLLHEEMRMLNSLIITCAEQNKIPAGTALSVDREKFAENVEFQIVNHKNITVIDQEISDFIKDEKYIIASGPLTSDKLSKKIIELTGQEHLAFFDAIAPIIYKESINFDLAWFQSRYDKGDGKDYINCPLKKEEYYTFIDELIKAEKTEFKEWEKDTPYFEGCLPIEVMADRGPETLRYGPMKPVGLTNPNSSNKPYAVVQLRQDNKLGTLYNMVGFQTKLKYGEQKRIFKLIPGLENVEFARLGGIHRNMFIKSPVLLDENLRLKNHKNIRFSGQITGVEGYVESAACGIMAAIFTAAEITNKKIQKPSNKTAIGALLAHITTDANIETFQPMNINYGLIEPPEIKTTKKDRKKYLSNRALTELAKWIKDERIIS